MKHERRSIAISPMMESALRAMMRGPLHWHSDGWRSGAGAEGVWNSHSILYMASRRWLYADGDTATIADGGISRLAEIDGGIAA